MKGCIVAHRVVDSSAWEYLPLSCFCAVLLSVVKRSLSIVAILTSIRLPFITVFWNISTFSTSRLCLEQSGNPRHAFCSYILNLQITFFQGKCKKFKASKSYMAYCMCGICIFCIQKVRQPALHIMNACKYFCLG